MRVNIYESDIDILPIFWKILFEDIAHCKVDRRTDQKVTADITI